MELRKDSGPIKWILIILCFLFLTIFLLLPLFYIIATAFRDGISGYLNAVTDEYAIKAALLTLKATLWAVAINTIFGVAAAWFLTKFSFKGKKIL